MPSLLRPSIAFASTAMAGGIVVTFLPLALSGSARGAAELALLAQAVAMTGARWWAGGHGDRHGAGRLLLPAVVASAAGLLALALTSNLVAVLGGMVVFGVGFGIAQNASLALMFQRVPRSDYGTVSAVWNLAYDAGLGLGAVGFGVLAAQTGYSLAFVLTGVLMLAAVVPAWRDRRAASSSY
jgi:predicted MFS family arabinose efflux permease